MTSEHYPAVGSVEKPYSVRKINSVHEVRSITKSLVLYAIAGHSRVEKEDRTIGWVWYPLSTRTRIHLHLAGFAARLDSVGSELASRHSVGGSRI